ncbi:MAG: hypothetical protein KDD43_00235 [Bdellovibrionales bacterium]|nr:hypothetical protein [Bdellovibrionales bacterium]
MNQLESVETEKEMVGINANDTKSKDHADQPTFLSRKEISDQVISLFQVDQQKGVSWVLSRVSDSNLADLAPSFIQETKHRIENGSFWVIPEKVVDYVTYSFLGGFQGNPTPWASEWKAKYLFLESQKRAKKEDEQRRIEREKEESLRARGGITSMANIVSPERMNQILGEIKF